MAGAWKPTPEEVAQARDDEELLSQWPGYMKPPVDQTLAPEFMTGVPLAGPMPNLWSPPAAEPFYDPIEDHGTVANQSLVLAYPLTQFDISSVTDERARAMCEWNAAAYRDELRRMHALDGLEAQSLTPMSDIAGEVLKELNAPRHCVVSNSTVHSLRVELRKFIHDARATKEHRCDRASVLQCMLYCYTVEPYMQAVHPEMAKLIKGYKRARVPPRSTRARPEQKRRAQNK